MIPAKFGVTFTPTTASIVRDNAFRLCFQCHDSDDLLGDTSGRTNFRARRFPDNPNPVIPRNYSLGRSENNEHFYHVVGGLTMPMPSADSDWDTSTSHSGPGHWETMIACFTCHNVHGAIGVEGSTNEAMIRDGRLCGRTSTTAYGGYGFSYVIEDVGAGGYPMVTSTNATQSNSVGAIFRNNTTRADMCNSCHVDIEPPGNSYNAQGTGLNSYVEHYRPWQYYGPYGP